MNQQSRRGVLRVAVLAATAIVMATAAAVAQQADGPSASPTQGAASFLQSDAAPIERAEPASVSASEDGRPPADPGRQAAGVALTAGGQPGGQINSRQIAAGVYLRSGAGAEVQTVAGTGDTVELRLSAGTANVAVRHPDDGVQILVDLPGGQTALLRDGLYTFNAATNTVRVIDGEADVLTGRKGVRVKAAQQFVFGGGTLRAVDVDRRQAFADLLPGGTGAPGYGDGRGYAGDGYAGDEGGYAGYGYAGYGYGFPGYGFGYGYPFGYGYGGFGYGLGFGYGGYGGYGGGFRGGRR